MNFATFDFSFLRILQAVLIERSTVKAANPIEPVPTGRVIGIEATPDAFLQGLVGLSK